MDQEELHSMYHVKLRKKNIEKRKLRVRKKIFGTSEIPRLSIFKSNKHIQAQIVDDEKGVTLVSFSSQAVKMSKETTKTKEAFEVGKEIAKRASEKKIKHVVFDRNGYRYHGRVKSLADGCREGGLLI